MDRYLLRVQENAPEIVDEDLLPDADAGFLLCHIEQEVFGCHIAEGNEIKTCDRGEDEGRPTAKAFRAVMVFRGPSGDGNGEEAVPAEGEWASPYLRSPPKGCRALLRCGIRA